MKSEASREGDRSGWENETQKHTDSIVAFLKRHEESTKEDRPKYDHISDLHFSGTNRDVFGKIKNGTAVITEVSILYEAGEPKQVHVVFDSEGKGHNIDVYLQNKALDDYLSTIAE